MLGSTDVYVTGDAVVPWQWQGIGGVIAITLTYNAFEDAYQFTYDDGFGYHAAGLFGMIAGGSVHTRTITAVRPGPPACSRGIRVQWFSTYFAAEQCTRNKLDERQPTGGTGWHWLYEVHNPPGFRKKKVSGTGNLWKPDHVRGCCTLPNRQTFGRVLPQSTALIWTGSF